MSQAEAIAVFEELLSEFRAASDLCIQETSNYPDKHLTELISTVNDFRSRFRAALK